jgi:dipeptidyl-peptidase-4
MNIPGSCHFSPDGRILTYLFSPEGTLTRQLFALDLQTGDSAPFVTAPDDGVTDDNIPLEEVLRRERLRQREFGITQYAWSKNGRILIPIRNDLYLKDPHSPTLRLLVAGGSHPCQDAQFSPDGQWVAYVHNAELHVIATENGQPQQITNDARSSGKTNGLAEYIAQEELGRSKGFWWSPDSQSLAFAQVDETHIPIYRIMHQGKDAVGEQAQEDHRYPFAGKPNARVRLGVISRDGGAPVWMDLGDEDDFYLARVHWLPNGRLTAQRLNRSQTQLDLLQFDPATGVSATLLSETSAVWINLHNLFRPLADGRFIWASERSGFTHLYLYSSDGQLIRPLTQGEWQVDEIVGVDGRNEQLYITATHPYPTERHLHRIHFDGRPPTQLTTDPGWHTIVLDVKNGRYLQTHESTTQPPRLTLHSLDGSAPPAPLPIPPDPRLETLPLITPELVTLTNRHNHTLHGLIYRPAGDGPFPTIVSVYGGPHAQRVTNSWGVTVDMRAQYLAAQGYLVFKLDNRGSARRGLAFESVIRHNMGDVEVQDQVDGVRWLVAQGLADPQRVGIYGWSYGGYMTLMCLARAADTFHVGVAGAPVTHWDGYDTGYTERYMGTPQSNPAGYEISSVMPHVPQMQGKLMLVHGLLDENVHFRHTARLMNALNRAQKQYDLLLFPDERHMPRKAEDRLYMEERIVAFFGENL